MALDEKTKTITALNDATDGLLSVKPLNMPVNFRRNGTLGFSIDIGTLVGTIAVQRSTDSEVTWADVEEYQDSYEGIIEDSNQDTYYRLQCTAFTSGEATVKIYGNK